MAKVDDFAGVRLPRSPVYGTKAMVVSGHSLASLAGLRTLERGGSVVDAMIATSAVLCVVIPHATSLGGDAFIIHHDAKAKKTTGLNASGHAPAGATAEAYRNGISERGPLAPSVPGIVRGWQRIHARHGRLEWESLFADAIDLAENGHPLSRVLAGALNLFRDAVSKDPGCSGLYMPGGTAMKAGDIVRNPALAKVLRAIAKDGSDVYYEGWIGKSLGDYCTAKGGLLGSADFAGYEPEWVDTISASYRGLDVHVMPPNSFGLLMLLQLNALSGLPAGALACADEDRFAYLMAAARAAFAEGYEYICDPRVHPAPLDELLGGQIAGRMQAKVRAAAPGPNGTHPPGGTSCITMVDGEGNGISVVQSVFSVFGSAFLDPNTGILLNNRVTGFSTDPKSRNVVAPGKRPAHTLNPVMVLDKGNIRYLLTTPGSWAQTVSNIQVLTNMVERGMELSAAIEAPRWALNAKGEALLDDDVPASVEKTLNARGHAVARAPGSSYFGSSKCVEVMKNGVLVGVADRRREAFAVGR